MKVIEVFADVWCPFAHVGLNCVVDRRAQLEAEGIKLNVRAWPLELVNGEPLDPVRTTHHVRDLQRQVAHLFRRFDGTHFPRTSLPALACAHAAYRNDMTVGEAVSLALRSALFEKGLDISQPQVLSTIARSFGIRSPDAEDDQAVLDDWHEGVKRGVVGSPHFFCGDSNVFCPSLEIAQDGTGHLEVSRNMDALDVFLAKCFTS